jgi:hypothetical protein
MGPAFFGFVDTPEETGSFRQNTDDISDARVYGGYIFEPTRMQERVWAELSAEQSTRTTYGTHGERKSRRLARALRRAQT